MFDSQKKKIIIILGVIYIYVYLPIIRTLFFLKNLHNIKSCLLMNFHLKDVCYK